MNPMRLLRTGSPARLLIALFALALLLAACGDTNGDDEGAQPDDADTDEPADDDTEDDEADDGDTDDSEADEGSADGDEESADIYPELSFMPTGPSDELVAAAEEESGSLTMFLSIPPHRLEPVFEAFQEEYPFVTDINSIELSAGEAASRMLQESETGTETADFGENAANQIEELVDRGLIGELDADQLGLPPEMMPDQYRVNTATSTYGVVVNTERVSEDEYPDAWEDLLDDRWAGGQMALWVVPSPFANLGALWGEDRLREFTEGIADHDPIMIDTPASLIQTVSSGEVPLGVGSYHQAAAVQADGAPIEFIPLEPVSVTLLDGFVPEAAANPNTGRLFLAWAATEEGHAAREDATYRGIPNIPGLTADLYGDRPISGFGHDETAEFSQYSGMVRDILPGG